MRVAIVYRKSGAIGVLAIRISQGAL